MRAQDGPQRGVDEVGRGVRLGCGEAVPGIDLGGRFLDSEAALQLPEIPKNPIILGGGVIGVEFASVWKSLGAESDRKSVV